jgi:predicted RNA-binding Zn-ribbon protein involved in translation (DUF1610 family)
LNNRKIFVTRSSADSITYGTIRRRSRTRFIFFFDPDIKLFMRTYIELSFEEVENLEAEYREQWRAWGLRLRIKPVDTPIRSEKVYDPNPIYQCRNCGFKARRREFPLRPWYHDRDSEENYCPKCGQGADFVESRIQGEVVAPLFAVGLVALEIVDGGAHGIASLFVGTDRMDDVPDHEERLKGNHHFVVFHVIADQHEQFLGSHNKLLL